MSPQNARQSSSPSSLTSLNRMSNPNCFSDEYALEPLDSHDISPVDVDDAHSLSTASSPVHAAPSTSRPISPEPAAAASRQPPLISYPPAALRNVTPSTPNRTASRVSNTFSDIHRASSTSSHFSMPRSQSPYVGATGPSHPYGMYPQITRASSIASASTVRPVERPFVPPGGPGHPYAMYSQNTVPEEEDVSLAQPTIPLGFPGLGREYQRGVGTGRDDIADIVGSDGHVEELPPYTRYADDMSPKEFTPNFPAARVTAAGPPRSMTAPQPLHTPHIEDGVVELHRATPQNTTSDSSCSLKEKVKRKSKQRICCGLPCWSVLIILGVLLFGVILGAIIGGVVGGNKSRPSNATPDTAEDLPTTTATVVSTASADRASLTSGQPLPTVPNGQYNIPTNDDLVLRDCIQDSELSKAWSCMPSAGIGLTVNGQGWNAELTVDAYPLDASFEYGAQPPDLGLQPLSLEPSMHRDLGPSLFGLTRYNKLTILREEELAPEGQSKRESSLPDGRAGEKPWFCWFNQTVLEFFIYVDDELGSSATTHRKPPYAFTASSFTTIPSITPSAPKPDAAITSGLYAGPPSGQAGSGPGGSGPKPPTYSGNNERRGYPHDDDDDDNGRNGYSDYPGLVKIEEKRELGGNAQPYCKQMQISEGGEISPVPGVASIIVPEVGSRDASTSERLRRRQGPAPDQNCACEWITR